MKVSVIGTGYVGLVTGACLAELGHEVICLDLNEEKISTLNHGSIPIYEPGLEAVVQKNRENNRLKFTSNIRESVSHGLIQIIAVGTPPDEDGSADMKYVLAAAEDIGRNMEDFKIIINKSTVPIGAADSVNNIIKSILKDRGIQLNFSVISNPEFLKEGFAINDFMNPDRIIIGINKDGNFKLVKDLIEGLYKDLSGEISKIIYMDLKSAELTKYAANAMLATRISFMNDLANFADIVGANIDNIKIGLSSDDRIGRHFLNSGVGYGGSCFPKDVRALLSQSNSFGYNLTILNAVDQVNRNQVNIFFDKILKHFSGDIRNKTFAIWGLSFKPDTDDIREAPSLKIIEKLIENLANINAFDPVSNYAVAQQVEFINELDYYDNKRIKFFDDKFEALLGADALLILTEWTEFVHVDFNLILKNLTSKIIFDGRNIYQHDAMEKMNFKYISIGRNLR